MSILLATSGPLAGQRYTEEVFSFATRADPDDDEPPVEVEATAYIPARVRRPMSAVIIVPSSGGVEEEREIYYALELAKVGIAAIVVDSFTARGVENSLYDQSALESSDIENDAFAALRMLAADPRFDRKRIAIMGVSKGGTVARDTALAVRRKLLGRMDLQFAAHIAIAPDCVWTNRSSATTGAPMLFLLAELDDQTPPGPCVVQARRMIAAGNAKVSWKTYIGAHHAWEELGASPHFDARIENYSKCRVWIEDDGSMHAASTGDVVPDEGWRDWARTNCMTTGATCCGGTPALKTAATRDVIEFLRRQGF